MSDLTQNQKRIFIIIGIIAIAFIGYYVYGSDKSEYDIKEDEEILVTNENEEKESKEEKIVVYIIGEVKNAGIVELKEGSRIADAINLAGGLTENADVSRINLAYVLEDGMKITIPSINESQDEKITEDDYISTGSGAGVDIGRNENVKSEEKVNINKATQTQLETLPGIGPSIALKIIEYRNENGEFKTIEELKNVNGVGEEKFKNIKNLICIK